MTPTTAARLKQTTHGTYQLTLNPATEPRDLEITVMIVLRATDDTDSTGPDHASRWTPPTTVAGTDDPTLTPYEHALNLLVTADSYSRYGRSLVHG